MGSPPHRTSGRSVAGSQQRKNDEVGTKEGTGKMSYEVNLEGLEGLRSAQATQFGYLAGGESFAMGSCAPGVFDRGVLALFHGQYSEAHGLLMDAMRSATDAADRVRETLADTLRTYIEDDVESATSLSSLDVEIDVMSVPGHAPYRPGDPIPWPSGAGSYATGAAELGLDGVSLPLPPLPEGPFPLTSFDRYVNDFTNGTAADPVSMVTTFIDVVNYSATTGRGLGDRRDYEQYIRENS